MNKTDTLNYLNKNIKSKTLHHAILFACPNQEILEEISNEFSRMIVCKNSSLEFDDCEWCIKASRNLSYNILNLGNGIEKIKKEEVSKLIKTFSSTNIENTIYKIYKIKNAENLSEVSANSLLKFLEEPPKNTLAILLTNDLNQVLQTIKSRCLSIVINGDQNEKFHKSDIEDFILNKEKENLLLYAREFKKIDKLDQIKNLESVFHRIILNSYPKLADIFLDSILELKNSSYTNLVIENLFISIYEAI
ncbi:DNA polymerase III subunit delta' [Spiroplasma gladiatoris]|uniref:DNA polymerase III subunit delta n=1 Tax=Spiroplasma gladiatoris TaxID=2143 RepID=A0A4P7AGK4_9MOLU|nr:hypothetical protein [Spiroplasma gladiatoris]QBQ07211.1 DNA polymerase III subunit delta' [Spiroplasma gladiatoris]